jgi:hypothetical protein
MNNFLLNSPFSILLSIILLISNYSIGHFICKIKKIKHIFSQISNINFQKILLGQIILIFFIFPLIVFFERSNVIFFFFILINFFSLFWFLKEFILFKKYTLILPLLKNQPFYFYILLLIIFLYFLLASSPITDADSLDYHLGSAFNILKYKKYILFKEWFTLAQSGAGEVLIALGLFLGAEQYSSLVQFSGLLSICGILIKASETSKFFKSPYFLALVVLTCPVLLFLVSTAKPQLFFSACLLIALSIIFRNEWKKDILISYCIINALIFICIIGKFSFNLSGFLIWILATIRILNLRNILKLFFISILFFILIYLPYIYWKWSQYEGNFFLYFVSPFPLHLPGYDYFLEHVRAPSSFKFPYFLFTTNSLSTITDTLGFSSLIFLYFISCKKNYEIYSIVSISILYLIVSNLYASPNARYFFDIILWLAFALKYVKNSKNLKFLHFFYLIQIFIVVIVLSYSVYSFFPGSITQEKYSYIKNKHGNEFTGVKWVEKELDRQDVLIFARSISMYSGTATSGLFINFTNLEQSLYYKNLIKEKKIKFYATFGETSNFGSLEGCIEGLYKYKDNVGGYAVRNPFSKGPSYNGYIYHLNYSKLPNCEK